jgi:uncharacterized protein (DUF427 family)
MDAFYEEDERILGHAADRYPSTSARPPVASWSVTVIASLPIPTDRWFSTSRASRHAGTFHDPTVDESALTSVKHQTFCPYKGLCSYYDIGDARLAAWSYREAHSEVGRISDLVSFEPDIVSVQLDGKHLRLEPGQTVIPRGPDRGLDVSQMVPRRSAEIERGQAA